MPMFICFAHRKDSFDSFIIHYKQTAFGQPVWSTAFMLVAYCQGVGRVLPPCWQSTATVMAVYCQRCWQWQMELSRARTLYYLYSYKMKSALSASFASEKSDVDAASRKNQDSMFCRGGQKVFSLLLVSGIFLVSLLTQNRIVLNKRKEISAWQIRK